LTLAIVKEALHRKRR